MENEEWVKYQGQCNHCERYHKLGGLFYSTLESGIKKLYCPRCGTEAKMDVVRPFEFKESVESRVCDLTKGLICD
jgi:hypothetical protein